MNRLITLLIFLVFLCPAYAQNDKFKAFIPNTMVAQMLVSRINRMCSLDNNNTACEQTKSSATTIYNRMLTKCQNVTTEKAVSDCENALALLENKLKNQ